MLITDNQLVDNFGKFKVYSLFGEERLLIDHSLKLIYNYLQQNDYSNKIALYVDSSKDFARINEQISNVAIFTANKIVELRINNLEQQTTKNILNVINKIVDGVVLILVFGTISWQQQKSKWFGEIKNNSLTIEHKKVTPTNMLRWVIITMKGLGVTPHKRIANMIAYYNLHNLPNAYNEIQKIKYIQGERDIDEDFIAEQLRENSQYSIYNLIDKALSGEKNEICKIYYSQHYEPMHLINLLYMQIKQLISIHLAKNSSLDRAIYNSGVWKNRVHIIKSALQNNSYSKLQKMLLDLGRCERSIKGLGDAFIDEKLLSLLLKFAK